MKNDLYAELFSLTKEDPFSRYFTTDEQRTVVALLLEKAINKKNIRITGMTYSELKENFLKKGLNIKELSKTLIELEIHLRGGYVRVEKNGRACWMYEYTPAIGVRHVAYKFLEQHPEIKDVKDDFGSNPTLELR